MPVSLVRPAELPMVLASHIHLSQIISNIMLNAAEAMQACGGGDWILTVTHYTRSVPALLIVWHSRTGGAEAMARAACDAASGETAVSLVRAEAAGPAQLLEADGYLFVCPENLATMSGEMKAFFDRCYYPVLGAIEGRPYAAMICAGSDGEGAARQIARIATGWRLKAVAEPLIVCTNAQTQEAILATKTISETDLARCRELGATLAAGLAMGVF